MAAVLAGFWVYRIGYSGVSVSVRAQLCHSGSMSRHYGIRHFGGRICHFGADILSQSRHFGSVRNTIHECMQYYTWCMQCDTGGQSVLSGIHKCIVWDTKAYEMDYRSVCNTIQVVYAIRYNEVYAMRYSVCNTIR